MTYFTSVMKSLLTLMKAVLTVAVYLSMLLAVLIPAAIYLLRLRFHSDRKTKGSEGSERRRKLRVAFFHPYCDAGGGGERVLWVAVQLLQERYPEVEFYVYTGDQKSPKEILLRVDENFNLKIDESNLKFVFLKNRRYVEGQRYRYFTLLFQSLGSMVLGYEALRNLNPDVIFETTGFSFVLFVFKCLAGCRTGSYVHYPIVTSEMIKRVSKREISFNNRREVVRSPFLSYMKLGYYKLFGKLYRLAGNCSDVTIANSSFTLRHLNDIWSREVKLVYPPCEVGELKNIPRSSKFPNSIRILSVSQFRPEKNHQLQIHAIYELRELIPETQFSRIKLVLCGSSRNQEDSNRISDLRDFAKHLSLENSVEFRVNLTYRELMEEFRDACLGIHTMTDEHFGIGVVELMASGLVTIAHRSGGPLLDIIETSETSRLGFLATTAEEYARTIKHVVSMNPDAVGLLIDRARASVERFSTDRFREEFSKAVEPLFC